MTSQKPLPPEETNVLRDESSDWVRGIPLSRRAAFTLLLAAGFLITAEITARLDDRVRLGTPLLAAPDVRHDLVVRDSLGPRGRPNGHFQRWKLNSAGFRSPESVLTPMPGCVRVMVLGASESFGAEFESPGKEYPAQLADSLATGGCYQVMNAAIAGATTPGMIGLWTGWASRYHPDIVVILANPVFYLSENAPTFPHPVPDSGGAGLASRLWLKAHDLIHYPAFINRRRAQRQLDALTTGHPDGWLFRVVPQGRLARYRQDLDSLITVVRARGAEPLLGVYPTRFEVQQTAADSQTLTAYRQFSPRAAPDVMLSFVAATNQAIRDLGRERHVAVIDLPVVITGRRELFGDFVHYTDVGAGLVAGTVAHAVRAMPGRVPSEDIR